ncbi:hypothetical protein BC830DRAFT_714281 [Chytriomyces sp. MP71]|nr:hypothetical protein BC830DRAFT_714281 [Chytriomyces sp. MP71]
MVVNSAPLPPPGNLVKELTLSPLALPPRSDTASPIYSKMSNFQAVHDFDLDAFLTQSSQGGEASTMQRLHHMQMQQIPTQTQLMLQYPQTPGYQNMVPESPSEGREGRYPFECPDSRCAKVINSRQSWAYHKLRCPTLPKAPPSRGRKAASSLRFDHSEMQHNVQISATGQVAIPRLGPPEPTPNGNNPPKRLSRMHKTYTGPVLPQTTVPMAPKSLATTNMDTFWSHDNVTALDPSLPSAGASSSAVAALSEEPFDFHSAEIGNTLLVPPPLLDGPGLSAIIGSSGPFTRQNSANTAASTAASTGAPMQRSHAYPTRNSRFSSSTASSPLHTMAIANSTMIAMASGGRRKLNSVTEVQEISTEDFALSQTETGISRGELEQLFEDYSSQASPDEYSSLIPDQVEPEWMWSAEKVFSKQQLSLLKMQMCNNFQLVAQTYVMEKEMHGADAYETQHWEDQLRALESLRDFGIKNLGPTSFCNVLPVSRFDLVAALQSNARNQPRSEAARTFIKCMSYQHTESECKERMAKQLEVSLGQKTRSGKARSAEARWSSAAFSVAPLFEGLVKLQEVCRTGWSVELVPNILRMRKKKVPDFLPHEDALLLRGLICFGVADLDSIRALCLPAKTIAGISGRIKALTARGKQDNALKSLLLRPFKPLTILEKDLMRVVIDIRLDCGQVVT